MTVLAYFSDLGIAVSDVLLTVDAPGLHILLPTIGSSRNIPNGLTLSPSRLVRKFFRIRTRGLMGMFLVAGTVSHIEKLIENLQVARAKPERIPPKLQRTFNQHAPVSIVHTAVLMTEDQGYSEFELLGVVEGELYMRIYEANLIEEKLPYYGSLIVAGSGGQDLHRWIKDRALFYADHAIAADTDLLKAQRAMNSVPMMLLEEDTLNIARTIRNGVGGYYEAYWIDEKTLEPIDDVLTVIASVSGKGESTTLNIERIYYHKYVNDWLLVISLQHPSLSIRSGETLKIPLTHFQKFPIAPIFEPGAEPNWTLSRLLKGAETADQFRLQLRREDQAIPSSKRFAEGSIPSRRLFKLRMQSDYVGLSLDPEQLKYFVSRFPKNGRPDDPALQLR